MIKYTGDKNALAAEFRRQAERCRARENKAKSKKAADICAAERTTWLQAAGMVDAWEPLP